MFKISDQLGGVRLLSSIMLISVICSSCSSKPPNFKELETQGEQFTKDSVQAIGQHWDSQAMNQRADASLKAAGDMSSILKIFASKLGPLKEIKAVRREKFKEFVGVSFNQPDYAALYKCSVDYQLSPATVLVGVVHKDNHWYVNDFHVDAQSLDDMTQSERDESKKYVEHVVPVLCRNLNIDCVKQNADSMLTAELSDNIKAMAAKSIFMGVSKQLGQFQNIDDPIATGCSLFQGQYVYSYSIVAKFEHGNAVIRLVTVKQNGAWKVRAFKIKAHPKSIN